MMMKNHFQMTWLNIILSMCLLTVMLIAVYSRNLQRSYLVLVHKEYTSNRLSVYNHDRSLPISSTSGSPEGSPSNASSASLRSTVALGSTSSTPVSTFNLSSSPTTTSPENSPQSKNSPQSTSAVTTPSSPPTKPITDSHLQQLKDLSETHVWGLPMEPVHVNYTRNIYFSVKSTYRYYSKRILDLMLTWFQVVDKHKLTIVSDKHAQGQPYVDMIRQAGFHIVDSNCSMSYSDKGLCCKLGTEFANYYEAVEQHEADKDSYQWFCHFDDDVYVNVPQLSKLLQQYDPHQPYYIGKWPSKQRGGAVDIPLSNQTARHMRSLYTLKQMAFRYATGASYCISQSIMMEAKQFFNGQKAYWDTYTLAHLPDDMTVGLLIGIVLGYNLTDCNSMKNQYDYLYPSTSEELSNYVTVGQSVGRATTLRKTTDMLTPSTRFGSYHCLLYPSVSWCPR